MAAIARNALQRATAFTFGRARMQSRRTALPTSSSTNEPGSGVAVVAPVVVPVVIVAKDES
jgi:hypothetical protein